MVKIGQIMVNVVFECPLIKDLQYSSLRFVVSQASPLLSYTNVVCTVVVCRSAKKREKEPKIVGHDI